MSVMCRPRIVTLPVFAARKLYVTVWPAVDTLVGLADLTTVSPGAAGALTVAVDPGEVTVPPEGVVPDTVAELVIDPLSISAWVTV